MYKLTQVLRILLDWGNLVIGIFTFLIPSGLYTAQTLSYLVELKFAFCDLSSVTWVNSLYLISFSLFF